MASKTLRDDEKALPNSIEWESERLLKIVDLLTIFDEFGFQPTVTMRNPEEYAIMWREALKKAIAELL